MVDAVAHFLYIILPRARKVPVSLFHSLFSCPVSRRRYTSCRCRCRYRCFSQLFAQTSFSFRSPASAFSSNLTARRLDQSRRPHSVSDPQNDSSFLPLLPKEAQSNPLPGHGETKVRLSKSAQIQSIRVPLREQEKKIIEIAPREQSKLYEKYSPVRSLVVTSLTTYHSPLTRATLSSPSRPLRFFSRIYFVLSILLFYYIGNRDCPLYEAFNFVLKRWSF
jgi:hypothetical protein